MIHPGDQVFNGIMHDMRAARTEEGSPPTWGGVLAAMADPAVVVAEGYDDARGWPRLALWCSLTGQGWFRTPAAVGVVGGIAVSVPATEVGVFRALPLRPIWSGLLIDTAFYGAAIWAAAWVVTRLRRARRSRAGSCPWCSYSLAGLAQDGTCPECGR